MTSSHCRYSTRNHSVFPEIHHILYKHANNRCKKTYPIYCPCSLIFIHSKFGPLPDEMQSAWIWNNYYSSSILTTVIFINNIQNWNTFKSGEPLCGTSRVYDNIVKVSYSLLIHSNTHTPMHCVALRSRRAVENFPAAHRIIDYRRVVTYTYNNREELIHR